MPADTQEARPLSRLHGAALLIAQILVIILGFAVFAYIGSITDCNGDETFDEDGTPYCQRVIE